ncbi:hypothetical protein C8Q74DRAFT_270835 [Fomes fomentarius]|nr:hypothetical protein C8Q74DRAFT_270835 [Fomes fomentarius]
MAICVYPPVVSRFSARLDSARTPGSSCIRRARYHATEIHCCFCCKVTAPRSLSSFLDLLGPGACARFMKRVLADTPRHRTRQHGRSNILVQYPICMYALVHIVAPRSLLCTGRTCRCAGGEKVTAAGAALLKQLRGHCEDGCSTCAIFCTISIPRLCTTTHCQEELICWGDLACRVEDVGLTERTVWWSNWCSQTPGKQELGRGRWCE